MEPVEGFGIRHGSDGSHGEPFQDWFGLQGRQCWQEDVNKSDSLCPLSQMGLLPESRAVVVHCDSQAGGWGAAGGVRSLGPWFIGGTLAILRDVGRGVVLQRQSDRHT